MQSSPWNFPCCMFCNKKIILCSDRKWLHRTAFYTLSKKKKKRSQGVPDVSAWHTTVPSTSLSLKKPAGCDVWSCITELMSPLWVSLSLPCQPRLPSLHLVPEHDHMTAREGLFAESSRSRLLPARSIPWHGLWCNRHSPNLSIGCSVCVACLAEHTHTHTHTS